MVRQKNQKFLANEDTLVAQVTWPIQVLELLVCNHEQATIGLQRAKFVLLLGKILRALKNSPDTKRSILVIRWIARIYSTVMGRHEARA